MLCNCCDFTLVLCCDKPWCCDKPRCCDNVYVSLQVWCSEDVWFMAVQELDTLSSRRNSNSQNPLGSTAAAPTSAQTQTQPPLGGTTAASSGPATGMDPTAAGGLRNQQQTSFCSQGCSRSSTSSTVGSGLLCGSGSALPAVLPDVVFSSMGQYKLKGLQDEVQLFHCRLLDSFIF